MQKVNVQKHLSIYLDESLNLNFHLKEKIAKVNKGIGILGKLRPQLDYGDIVYDKAHNEIFCKKIKTIQYQASLTVTGTYKEQHRKTFTKN